jgi:hypothetical protein
MLTRVYWCRVCDGVYFLYKVSNRVMYVGTELRVCIFRGNV